MIYQALHGALNDLQYFQIFYKDFQGFTKILQGLPRICLALTMIFKDFHCPSLFSIVFLSLSVVCAVF